MINVKHTHAALPSMPSGPYELNPCKGFFSIVTAAGQVITLNSLGVKVLSYIGGGMPPVENITTPLGILGGSVLQRTVARPRTITLACAVYGRDLLRVQRIKQSLISLVAPSASLQTPANIKLRYQLVDGRGTLLGNILEVAVIYQGDLTGITDNLYEERFALQFLELAPPGIVELTVNQPSLGFSTSLGTIAGEVYRTANGVWTPIAVSSAQNIFSNGYDAAGDLWYSYNATIRNRSGTVNQAITAAQVAEAMILGPDNAMYFGGGFTSPYNYIMKYTGGVFSQVGATINGSVGSLAFDNQGRLYASGNFTAPATRFARWDGATWSTLGTGPTGGAIKRLLKGLDGNIYAFGDFTALNGVAAAGAAKYDITTGVVTALATSISASAIIWWAENMPDGRIIAVGQFTLINGVTAYGAAYWNGSQWTGLNPGIGATAGTPVIYTVQVDQSNGDIYLFGLFNKLTNSNYSITAGAIKLSGNLILPIDINTSGSIFSSAYRASDKELAIGIAFGLSPTVSGGNTALVYAGTADVAPQIKITGPGQVFSIINYTTKKAIYFSNLYLQVGETATLTLSSQAGISFVSSFFGNILSRILPISDVSSFALVPGNNPINCYMTGTTGASKIEFIYQNTHWSFEAGV